ncbi:hypothetical protein C8Q74DRAFT_929624 [Fomes fomentarius]|nr:hypothetical protein C8Q74DRAFT_929624 [Fomes fomentarius]
MLRALFTPTLHSAPRSSGASLHATWAKSQLDVPKRSISRTSRRAPIRRQYMPEDLLRAKRQAEAVSGELPSTPVGPSIGFGDLEGEEEEVMVSETLS